MPPLQPGPVTVHDWRTRYAVTSPGSREIISQLFWHRRQYVSGTTLTLTFFNQQLDGLDGNLRLSGQLPNGYNYLIQALGVYIAVDPTETAAAAPVAGLADGAILTMAQLISQGYAELKIGEKPYGEWPIFKLPGGGGVAGEFGNVGTLTAPASSQIQHATNGPPDIRNVYSLPMPLMVPPQFGFTLKLQWPVAVTAVPAQSPYIFAWLDGQLMRPVQ